METLKNLNAYSPNFYPEAPTHPGLPTAKTLGTNANPELTTWYEEATNYYNAVMSGQEQAVDPAAWQSLLDQMEWAAGELGLSDVSSDWGNDIGEQACPPSPDSEAASLDVPEGASAGTMDNIVWNAPQAAITVPNPAGETRVHDIWSNTIDLTMPTLSGRISCELSKDTRLQPPEEVMKIVATDPATGAESVYFVHNYEDAEVNVHVLNEDQLVDLTGRANSEVYDPNAPAPAEPVSEASVPGQPMSENGEEYLLYDGGTSVIDFKPVGSGVADEKTIHDVEGSSNISVLNTDEVQVQKVAEGKKYDYLVKVTHTDGSIDEFRIHGEYACNLNGVPEHLKFVGSSGKPYTQQAEISKKHHDQIILASDFLDSFTVNGLEAVSPASTKPKPEKTVYPQEIQNLAEAMNLSAEDLVDQLADSNLFGISQYENKEGKLGTEELKQIVADGVFPPLFPTDGFEKLIGFLVEKDNKLGTLVAACKEDENGRFKVAMGQASARICDLLSAVYPDHNIAPENPNPEVWFEANDLTFDGMSFEALSDGWLSVPLNPYVAVDAMEIDSDDRGNIGVVVNE